MGLVFAARRAHIEVEELPRILWADGYRRLASWEQVMPGDLAIYCRDQEYQHVGVVIQTNPLFPLGDQILSKWGMDGEYIHQVADVPEIFGACQEFWTMRDVRHKRRRAK
jgi:hypothetical protein